MGRENTSGLFFRSSLKMGGFLFFALFLCFPALIFAQNTARLEILQGKAQVMRQGKPGWELVESGNAEVAIGDKVRTSSTARVILSMHDGSKVELGPSSIFVVDFLEKNEHRFSLKIGRIKAFVSKFMNRRFAVLTPTAVMAVRGTEFEVNVQNNGNSRVDLFEGLLAVSDNKGNEVLLNPGESLEATAEGLTRVEGGPQAGSGQNLKELAKKEILNEEVKESVQAQAALELKLAEYQLGKTMIDAFGQRVRVEQYVFKPSPNQAKFVVLNERADRFDYFFYLGTFNKELPIDVGSALLQIAGGRTLPEYYLTAFESYRSNTLDNMKEVATGGHLVDLGPAGTGEITKEFDPNAGVAVDLGASDHFYKTFYDDYALSVNGVSKITLDTSALSIAGSGNFQGRVQSLANEDASWRYAGDGVFTSVKGPGQYNGDMHYTIDNTFNDGTFLKYDTYMVKDDGKILNSKDFAGVTSGAKLKELMMSWNYEEVITATEFKGRKIDLVVDPKIFVQMGQANVQ